MTIVLLFHFFLFVIPLQTHALASSWYLEEDLRFLNSSTFKQKQANASDIVEHRVSFLTFVVIHYLSHMFPIDPLVCNRSDIPVNIL